MRRLPTLLAAALFASVGLMPAASARDTSVAIAVDRSKPVAVCRLRLGVTHTQYSLDPWGDPAAIAQAKALLAPVAEFHNQHIMGWGADNPEPAPGEYRWESLDRRMAMIRSLGGTPVITLCAAPDWMKGGRPGDTDWSKIEVAPLPEHYADFAALAAAVARRYSYVKHFQVWNEFKGFWKPSINNWDYEAYTTMYNMVYDALKAVDPSIKVGGPYLVVEGTGSGKGGWASEAPIRPRQWEVLNYWLSHKHGADFIVLDRGIRDFHDDHAYTPQDEMELTHWFADVARQVALKTKLPIWWAEYYGASESPEIVAANYASIYRGWALTGLPQVALLWSPQQSDVAHGLFTDTRQPGGGRPLPLYAVFRAFHGRFPPGTRLYQATSSSPSVEALASAGHTLLINKSAAAVDVLLDGRRQQLAGYEVRLVPARKLAARPQRDLLTP